MRCALVFIAFLCPALSLFAQQLSPEEANRLASLPLKCMQQEYPYKLGQVLNDSSDLQTPQELHPAFYGCFDWHSSVHGHWLLVRILKSYPDIERASEIRAKLNQNLSAANIQEELAYFQTKNNTSFERTYGWAWLLKLHQELLSWDDPEGKTWAQHLQPLADTLCKKYSAFLPKLQYPIRTGDHINTAFGLTFAYDYAVYTNRMDLQNSIRERALAFYANDKAYPLTFEPSGYDFLSPGLEEVDLMRRLFSKDEFEHWLKQFLPQLFNKKMQLEPGKVGDRSDGHLVHLDGLNFSRAWCLYGLANSDERFEHLRKLADQHVQHSLPSIVDGDYMGEHWLASFALLALLSK